MKFITLLLEAITTVFGFLKKKTELNNTPEMVQAKKAQNEAKENDKISDAIQKRDTKTIEKELSE